MSTTNEVDERKLLASVNLQKLLNGSNFEDAKPECYKLCKIVALNGEALEWVDGDTPQCTIDQINYENQAAWELLKIVKNMFRPYAEKEIENIILSI